MINITPKYYAWKHGKIRYIQAGRGEPLLLLHNVENGASLHQWKKVFVRLSKRYKVYAIDLLGFGGSAKPNMTYSSYLYARLINDFIQDVIKRPTFTAGVGLTGSYAVAASFLPESSIKKVMLIKPSEIKGKMAHYPKFMNVLLRWLLISPGIGAITYKMYCKACRVQAKCVPSDRFSIASLINGFLRVSIRGKLKKTAVPVTVCDKIDYRCFFD